MLEPLIHWGTVTPATRSQAIITFRRDGELMQIPAYKQLVKRSVDPNAPSYCVDCLQYLWSKRIEAQDIARQLISNGWHLQLPDSGWKNKTGTLQSVSNPSSTSFGAVTANVVRVGRPTAHQTKPTRPMTYEVVSTVSQGSLSSNVQMKPVKLQASFQLDGTSDDVEIARSPSCSDDHQGHPPIWEESASEENSKERIDCISSSSCANSPIIALRMAPIMLKGPGGSSAFTGQEALKKAPSSSSTSTQATKTVKENSPYSHTFIKNKYGFRVRVQTASLCYKERKFGRELDANSTAPLNYVKRSPRMNQASAAGKNLSMVRVQPMERTKHLRPLKKTNNPLKLTKRKNFTRDDQAVKQKKAHATGPREHKPAPREHHIDYTAGRRSTLDSHPTSPPSPPKLTAHFAKRPINSDDQEHVVALTYEAFQNTHPSPNSKICVCNKPASHGTFKKGEVPQISQCVNRDCRFRWYHYSCLNQSEKGKARWGTLVCQHCRNEEEFVEQHKKNGCNSIQQMGFRKVWSKDDIEAEMPGLGGHRPMANPYGLGVEIDLRPLYRTVTHSEDKLGGLEVFGYAQSRPHVLQEAYAKPDTHTDLRAIRTEDEAGDDQWWQRTHGTEECYSDDGELLDLDTEGEL